mgnify:CR=1 FL=1
MEFLCASVSVCKYKMYQIHTFFDFFYIQCGFFAIRLISYNGHPAYIRNPYAFKRIRCAQMNLILSRIGVNMNVLGFIRFFNR